MINKRFIVECGVCHDDTEISSKMRILFQCKCGEHVVATLRDMYIVKSGNGTSFRFPAKKYAQKKAADRPPRR